MIRELTEKDIDRLDDILCGMGENVMDLESIDGFFCAIACSPKVIEANDYLPVIFGGELHFEDEAILSETMELLFSFSNGVNARLRRPLKEPSDLYFPQWLNETDEDDVDGRLWAIGFMTGVSIFCEPWKTFLDDGETAQLLMPMMEFSGQGQEDIDIRTDPIPKNKQTEMLGFMFICLHEIYEHFADERNKSYKKKGLIKQSVDIFQGPIKSRSIGRNDLCHCGSGQKFKKCCLNKGQQVTH